MQTWACPDCGRAVDLAASQYGAVMRCVWMPPNHHEIRAQCPVHGRPGSGVRRS